MDILLQIFFKVGFADFLVKKSKNGLKRLDGLLGFLSRILSLLLIYCQTFQIASFYLYFSSNPFPLEGHTHIHIVKNIFLGKAYSGKKQFAWNFVRRCVRLST